MNEMNLWLMVLRCPCGGIVREFQAVALTSHQSVIYWSKCKDCSLTVLGQQTLEEMMTDSAKINGTQELTEEDEAYLRGMNKAFGGE